MASVGHSKVFILDKYFTELQKFWETEIKLQGIYYNADCDKITMELFIDLAGAQIQGRGEGYTRGDGSPLLFLLKIFNRTDYSKYFYFPFNR